LEKVKQKKIALERIGTLHNSELFGQKKIAREGNALSDEGY
jgi:hypothetical protein